MYDSRLKKNSALPNTKKINAILDPAVERFKIKTEEEQITIKKQFGEFKNPDNVLAQIMPYDDSDLEKLYIYLINLLRKLPRRDSQGYELGENVVLKYCRLQKIAEGAILLRTGEPLSIYGPSEVGPGSVDENALPSSLIHVLNERLGAEFIVADQLFSIK